MGERRQHRGIFVFYPTHILLIFLILFLLVIFLESLKRLLSHNCRSARILLILDRLPQSQRPESRIPIAEQLLFLASQSDEISVSDLIFNRNCGNLRISDLIYH